MDTAQKPWIVQKYGGTSLGKLSNRICGEIIPSFSASHRVAIVCSALSGKTKSSGTTSLLLDCIALIKSSNASSPTIETSDDDILSSTMGSICEHHLGILRSLRTSAVEGSLARKACEEAMIHVSTECDRVRLFLSAAQTVGELSPRGKDRVLSLGETLASIVVTTTLIIKDILAEAVNLSNIVEETFGPSSSEQQDRFECLGGDVYPILAESIGHKIRRCATGAVPVVTGFFGLVPSSLLQSVGRGYSDFCAALCAVGLGAQDLQIWKEVDGIFTADPRKIPSARLLPAVTFEEASELTYYGSEVIHPLTMEQVRRANVRLRIKNVFNPSGSGTRIYPTIELPSTLSSPHLSPSSTPAGTPARPSSPSPSFMLQNGYHGTSQNRRSPTAVTVKEPITIINVVSGTKRSKESPIFLMDIFERLARHGVAIDLVTSSEKSISMAVESIHESDTSRFRRVVSSLEEFGTVTISDQRSIISIVGHKMRNMVGVSSEIFSALASAKINIYMISQGASEINISVVVRADQALDAMDVIHQNVLRIPSSSEVENNFIKGPWLY